MFNFPVINVGESGMCFFNKAASQHLPKIFRWESTSEWLVLKPCAANAEGAFNIYKIPSKNGICYACRLPKSMRNLSNIKGAHKLFKSDRGLAFKRYEMIGVSE